MTTLLFCSLLLVALLILTLTSYRTLLLQIQMANNQLEAAESYWIAQGGLECIYSQVSSEPDSFSTFHYCELPEELDIKITRCSQFEYQIQSTYMYSKVLRDLTLTDGSFRWNEGSWRDFR
ncbi:hypothetical protein [Vibrio sp. HN007]|uniref:hypothetical protein n=1 Tax=Vibrio iocasae TaxID=3098914 RepID=UPI0035D45F55